MKAYGDIRELKGSEIPPVDIVTGGSPCQDLSVAGKRAGLAGERSGLFIEQVRLIKEMREKSEQQLRSRGTTFDRRYIQPRYMVWENVSGAFSSNKGEDFRTVLEETAKIADEAAIIPRPEKGKWTHSGCVVADGWSIAWRLHDAQYWGVPQRRKRICLVADFGGGTAPEILFELRRKTIDEDCEQAIADFGNQSRSKVQSVSESVSGNFAKSEEAGQGTSQNVKGSVGETSKRLNPWDVQSKSVYDENGIVNSLCSGKTEGVNIQPCILQNQVITFQERAGTLSTLNNQSVCYGIGSYDSNAMKSGNPHSGIYEADTSRTLDLNGGNPACNQGGMAIVQGVDAYNGNVTGDIAATLNATSCDSSSHSGPSVCILNNQGGQQMNCSDNVTSTLRAEEHGHQPIVCLEGNGQRESHKGDGYKESEIMYTLNTVEQHAVAYDGDAITNPVNGSNSKEDNPCHILNNDSRNYVIIENHPADSRVKISETGVVQTLSSRMGTGGGNVPMIIENTEPVVDSYQDTTGSLCASGYDKLGTQEALNDMYVVRQCNWDGSQVSPTLTANNANGSQRMPDKDNFNAVIAFTPDSNIKNSDSEISFSMLSRDYKDPQYVAYGLDRAAFNQGANAQYDFRIEEEKIGTQVAKGPGAVCRQSIVRRLTPLECTRLQGFPDGWVDIGEWKDSNGKIHKDSDSPKYKALGNSIAIPFWQWMAERMVQQLRKNGIEKPTMASLFSGIGGFELAYARVGAIPVWNSEIEEFPKAVTNSHFL